MLRIRYVLLLAIFCLSYFPARASHMLGGDIAYRNIGSDSLLVTVTLYRDCNGIDLSPSPMHLQSDCDKNAYENKGSVQLPSASGVFYDVTPVCKYSCTRCTYAACPFGFGIQKYFNLAQFSLKKYNCCSFTISWEQCCRPTSISTIPLVPGTTNQSDFFVKCKYNKCIQGAHASPQYTGPPIFIACKGQCVFQPQNTTGETGDSLIYKLIPPRDGNDSAIAFTSPYSYLEPIKYNGAFGSTTWDTTKCKGFMYVMRIPDTLASMLQRMIFQ